MKKVKKTAKSIKSKPVKKAAKRISVSKRLKSHQGFDHDFIIITSGTFVVIVLIVVFVFR